MTMEGHTLRQDLRGPRVSSPPDVYAQHKLKANAEAEL